MFKSIQHWLFNSEFNWLMGSDCGLDSVSSMIIYQKQLIVICVKSLH